MLQSAHKLLVKQTESSWECFFKERAILYVHTGAHGSRVRYKTKIEHFLVFMHGS